MSHVHKKVIFSGHVQGVGFRWTTQQQAKGLHIEGYVKNLDDGTVELKAKCSQEDFDTLLDRVKEAMKNNIENVVITDVEDNVPRDLPMA